MKKHKLYIGFIFSLIAVFSLSVLFCCCLSTSSEAKNAEVVSCHSTQDDSNHSAQNTHEECDCDQTFTFVKPQKVSTEDLVSTFSLLLDLPRLDFTLVNVPASVGFHSPPQYYSNQKLYTRHCVLRI